MSAYLSDPIFCILAVIGIFLTGISKSGFAGGAGVVAVPLLSLVISPAIAVVLVLPLLLLMDAQTIRYHRKNLQPQELRYLIPAALLGVVAGSFALGQLSDRVLLLIIGTVSLVFAWLQWRKHTQSAPAGKANGLAASMGLLAGMTSSLIHAGGPPLNIYLATRRLSPPVWIATAAVFFASINASKVLTYAWADLWQLDLFLISLLLIPAAYAGIQTGHVIARRMQAATFTKAILLLLSVSGIALIAKALTI